MKEKTKKWFVWSGIALVFLLIGMYVVPMVSFAVNPNASSRVINDMVKEYGNPTNNLQSGQWLANCNMKCNDEFNNNAQQLGICVAKCSNYVANIPSCPTNQAWQYMWVDATKDVPAHCECIYTYETGCCGECIA